MREPGLYPGIPNAEYHGAPNELSVSGAKILIQKTPLHYRWAMDHPTHKDTFDFGQAAHSLALEGDTTNITVVDADNWMSKAAKEAKAEARTVGKVPLLAKEFAQVEAMAAVLKSDETAAFLLRAGQPEVSAYRSHETGVVLRARFDWLPDDRTIVADYKTAVSASTSDFQRAVSSYGYHMQNAWYVDMLRELEGVDPKFVFLVQEKSAPYAINVIELDASAVAYGRQLNERAIRVYAECARTGRWPGYPLGEPIPLPRYAEYEADRILENE